MAMPVEVLVIVALRCPVFAGRDDRRHAVRGGLFDEGITVIAFVGEQVFGADPLILQSDQSSSSALAEHVERQGANRPEA